MPNLVVNKGRDFSYGVAPVSHPDLFISSTPSLSTPLFLGLAPTLLQRCNPVIPCVFTFMKINRFGKTNSIFIQIELQACVSLHHLTQHDFLTNKSKST